MTSMLSRLFQTAFFALALLILGAALPAAAQQPTSVNPTAQSVKEAQLLEALKPGEPISGRASIPNKDAANLIQAGRDWRAYNQETLPRLGMLALLGTFVALVLFYLIRGKIRIDAGSSSQKILRFAAFERFVHWLTATSFIMLAVTGANVTFGKSVLLPVVGPEAFSAWASFAKIIHNYVGFAFMAGVGFTFLIWVKDNIPDRTDIRWFLAGGGLLSKGKHPPAKRFNGGQKIVFWSVVLGGAMMSLSGWHLLFPTVEGMAEAQWHATIHGTIAFIMTALIIAHIYIGSVGMEGAIDAMASGEVDLNWAKEHHSIWVKEEQERKSGSRISGAAQPAE
ncbi:MAG: formate dehydrogenase subunit gamma [Rhizobiales bacterium PAR1]|nr:MAG: formate dehydrogenase subunit gamma [Rhizobiales bacterium PAR1]